MRALGSCVVSALLICICFVFIVKARPPPPNIAASTSLPSKGRLLVLCKESIRVFDLATGADQGEFLSKTSTGGSIWALDTIADKDGLLYIGG
jgi:hypothetical protein